MEPGLRVAPQPNFIGRSQKELTHIEIGVIMKQIK